ncbi:hypothetical protein D6W19_003122 [Escherichia coli]|nr:hypothetical protein [Escherichia coli]
MINRAKLQHILEYAKQQRHIGLHCKVPPEDMVKIVEMAMLQGADQATVKQPSSNSVLGWLRADYQDDNRGLRGNAPLFVLGKKDPSTVWGLDYIPLTSNSPVIPG